jgi:hypothetical protein
MGMCEVRHLWLAHWLPSEHIFSVNLGGWFVLEPFISPAIYQKYPGAVDEWTLSTLMAADTANGGLDQIEHHYDTFMVSLTYSAFFFSS